MLGAIVGDIIGSPYEFHPWQGDKDAFPLFCDASRFTDDTVMTVGVAEGIRLGFGSPERTYAAVMSGMRRYGQTHLNAGYGKLFFKWLVSKNPQPYNSFGNGAAMRVSAAGWAYDTLEDTEKYAAITAAITHDHPEGIKAACSVAGSIYLARTGAGKDDIGGYVSRHYDYNVSRPLADIRHGYHHTEYSQESVPEAICAFLQSRDFEDAVRNAVWFGGDCDTQAAIAGSIAEAFYGGVPAHIVSPALEKLDEPLRAAVVTWQNWLMQKTTE